MSDIQLDNLIAKIVIRMMELQSDLIIESDKNCTLYANFIPKIKDNKLIAIKINKLAFRKKLINKK